MECVSIILQQLAIHSPQEDLVICPCLHAVCSRPHAIYPRLAEGRIINSSKIIFPAVEYTQSAFACPEIEGAIFLPYDPHYGIAGQPIAFVIPGKGPPGE